MDRIVWAFSRGVVLSLASILCCGCGPGSSSDFTPAAPSAAAELPALAARTSGVAPLVVFFDAGAATPGEFLDREYCWDFGDPASGTWAFSGRAKSSDTGPLAGHVFELPGTHVVTFTVTDHAAGTSSSDTVTITVQDPDEVFAGTSTSCFSRAGDFTGAPAGAELVTATALSAVSSRVAPGKRLLLRRGETWTTGASFALNAAGPGILGAFGEGPAPVIRLTAGITWLVPSGSTPRLNDWRVIDLEVDGQGIAKTRASRTDGTCSQVLLLRCTARNVHSGFIFSTSQLESKSPPHALYNQIAIVDCVVDRLVTGLGGYGSMFAGGRVLFLGNRYDNQGGGEHPVRMPLVEGAVVAHCDLANPLANKHTLKLHGPPFTSGPWAGRVTRSVVIAHNTLRGGNASWTLAAGPEDDHTDQRVENVLLEGNHFRAGSQQQVACFLSAVGLLARNNLVDSTGGRSATAFSVARRGIEPAPSDLAFFHNTAYTADPDRFTFLSVASGVADVVSHGNLGVAPASTNKTMLSGSAASTANLLDPSPAFVVTIPAAPADFQLAPLSPALGFVPPVAEAWDDFLGAQRPDGNGDAGAFERDPPEAPLQSPPPPPPAGPVEIIADAHAAGTGVRKSGPNWSTGNDGEWYPSLVPGGNLGDSNYRKDLGGSYTWRFHDLEPGEWIVYASWTAKSSRSPTALYQVDGNEVRVDQRANGDVPGDPTTWNLLGTFDLPAGFDVTLVHDGEGVGSTVCADAIRLTKE